MVHLTKIYTKTGDTGYTTLANNERVKKTRMIVSAIGTVDEANSAIGAYEHHSDITDRIQNDLFDLGAELAGATTVSIGQDRIDWLENICDDMNEHLEPLHSFVLPTGMLHHARTVIRRAEREVLQLIESNGLEEYNELIPIYLNRLSDLLFIMARYYNRGNEKLWKPMGQNEKD
jgi:cob(I)alamin adenosyltransferase